MSQPIIELVVADGEQGRVDRFLARRYPEMSRKQLSRFVEDGHVHIGRRRLRKGSRVEPGDVVLLDEAPPTPESFVPIADDVPIEILYEDEDLIAVNKPAGLPCHPLRAGERDTLANRIVARFPRCAGIGDDPREAGLAHRLDTDTSGAILVARNRDTWQALRTELSTGGVTKHYLALVSGEATDGESDAPIAQRGKHAVALDVPDALPAHTRWNVLGTAGDFTLLACHATTGRRHQIRVHLAAAGHPLAGDELYGGPAVARLTGHFLHAERIELDHPRTGLRIDITAPLPPDREQLLAALSP